MREVRFLLGAFILGCIANTILGDTFEMERLEAQARARSQDGVEQIKKWIASNPRPNRQPPEGYRPGQWDPTKRIQHSGHWDESVVWQYRNRILTPINLGIHDVKAIAIESGELKHINLSNSITLQLNAHKERCRVKVHEMIKEQK